MAVNLEPPRPDDLLSISGVRLGIARAGIRKPNRKDLLLVALDAGTRVAAVFTRNLFAAAPVIVGKQHLAEDEPIRAIVVNTGVANAGTGRSGIEQPGDSLLFTIGLLVSQNKVIGQPLWVCCLVLSVFAVLSNVVGYFVGRKAGPAIFNRPDSRLFKQEHVDRTFAFFDKYGNRAIFLARFVPIIRTFITLAAGIGRMSFRRFVTYSALGGVVWATGVTLLGFWLGHIAFLGQHIDIILVLIVVVSVIPIGIEMLRSRARNTRYDEESEREAVLRKQAAEEE